MAGASPREQKKRQEIVRRSAALFLEAGFSGTSMSAIAATVGGSKTTLYNHFGSKEELFEEVVHMVLTTVIKSIDDIDYRTMDCRSALTAIATTIFSAAQAEQSIEVHRLVFFEAGRNGSGSNALMKRGPEFGQRYVREALEHFVSQDELVCRDADKAARYFFSILLYHHMLYREAGMMPELSRTQIAEHVDDVIEDFLRICPVL